MSNPIVSSVGNEPAAPLPPDLRPNVEHLVTEDEEAEADWLRWCDQQSNLLLTGEERAEQERRRVEEAQERAEKAEGRAERLADQLRRLGIEPAEGNS